MKYGMCIYVFLILKDIYYHLQNICMLLNFIVVFICLLTKKVVFICRIKKIYVFICHLILNDIYIQA